jgi:hypothetical protein
MADLTLSGATFNASGQYSYSLNGGSGQVANPIPTGGTWTLEAWVKDSTRSAVMVAFGAVDTFWLGCDASDNATARYGSGGTEVALNSSTNIMDGAWHHLALVLGADGGELFVDGTSVATSATTMSGAGASYSNNLGVRIFPGTAYAWSGEIDEVAIWDDEHYTGAFTPAGPIVDGTANLVSLWHLNNDGADTAAGGGGGGVTPIACDDAGILYSPYTWDVDATRAQTINPGAYLRTLFTGASAVLNFDTTDVTSPVPRLRISVDGRTNQSANVAATVAVTMPSGQDNDTHLLEVWVDATTETVNRWNSPQNVAVKLTGITLETGDDTVALPQRKPLNILCYGDSITEGVRTLALNGSNDLDRNSATVCWPLELGRQLGAEVGAVGFGSQGISDTGNGNVPALVDSWDWLWASEARVFTPAPDYCVWLQGYNDGTSNTQANGIAALDGMLTAMPGTTFILFRPLDGTNQEANLQAIAAGCSDPGRVRYISTAGFWSSSESPDALHPYGWACIAQIAPKMADAILTPAATTTRTVTVTLTTDGTTPAANLTGLQGAFFDSPQPGSFDAPAFTFTGESTDASGVLSVQGQSVLTGGGVGWLEVTDSDGTTAMEHSGFAGPVEVT